MNEVLVVDTGPLVALAHPRDPHHPWVKEQVDKFELPLLTCESVISEALFLLRKRPGGAGVVMGFLERRALRLSFRLQDEVAAISRLLQRYANVPMSLADACLVRMTEQHEGATVLTFDSDFEIYRKHRRQMIPTIRPGS